MKINFKNVLAGLGTSVILIIAIVLGMAGFANYDLFNSTDPDLSNQIFVADISESLAGENLCSYLGEYRYTLSPNNMYFGKDGKIYSSSARNRSITISGSGSQLVYKKYKFYEDRDQDGQNEEYESNFFDPRGVVSYSEGGEDYLLVLEYGDKKNPGAVLKLKILSSSLEMIYKWDNIAGAPIKPSDIKLIEGTQSSFLLISDYSDILKLEVNDDFLQSFVKLSLPKKIVGFAIAKGDLFIAMTESVQGKTVNKILRYRISDQKYLSEYAKNGSGEGEMNLVEDISADGNSLYISDIGNGKVIVLDITSFIFKNDFTSYDSSGNNLLLGVRKVFFDQKGNMYTIVDDPSKGSIVRMFNVKCSILSITKKYVKYDNQDSGYKDAFEFNIKDSPNAKLINLDFTLDDNNADATYPKIKKFSVKPGVSYKITEADTDDYDTNWVCLYPFRDSWRGIKIGNGRDIVVSISSSIQEQIKCTFYNFKKGDVNNDATIEIIKKWTPELDHEEGFDFMLTSVNNPRINEQFSLVSNNTSEGSKIFNVLSDKTYSINEFITSNYHKVYSEYICEFYDENGQIIPNKTKKGGNPTVSDVPAVSVVPKNGEKVVCTFTNCKDSNRNFICDAKEGGNLNDGSEGSSQNTKQNRESL